MLASQDPPSSSPCFEQIDSLTNHRRLSWSRRASFRERHQILESIDLIRFQNLSIYSNPPVNQFDLQTNRFDPLSVRSILRDLSIGSAGPFDQIRGSDRSIQSLNLGSIVIAWIDRSQSIWPKLEPPVKLLAIDLILWVDQSRAPRFRD